MEQEPNRALTHIFLETSILVDSNFNLDWPPLRAIIRCLDSSVILHTTSITLWEILDVGIRKVNDAQQRIKEIRKFFLGIPPTPNWKDPQFFRAEYERLCHHAHDGDGANLGDIVRMWIEQAPPFTEDKPPQFRDAMAFLSLQHWAQKEGVKIHVVAKDPDWKRACAQSLWCHNTDLGVLTAQLVAPPELDDEQLEKILFEIEPRMSEALLSTEVQVSNRPGTRYSIESISDLDNICLFHLSTSGSEDEFSTRLRFTATANLCITNRYGHGVCCDVSIEGEIGASFDNMYSMTSMDVLNWSFPMPSLRDRTQWRPAP